MIESKTCSRCRQQLPLESFYRRKGVLDGRSYTCKACEAARTKALRGPALRAPNAHRDETGKTCPRCQAHKPWADYGKHARAKDEHQTYCRPCCRQLEVESDEKHAVAVRARHAEKLARGAESAGVKTCTKCGETKPRLEFYLHRNTKDGRASHCQACAKAYGKAYSDRRRSKIQEANARRRADPVKRAKYTRDRKLTWLKLYGLTPETHDQLLQKQGGVCAICHRPGQVFAERNLHVDHDHATGQVRGLLCGGCNWGLGRFEDDTARLQRAIEYLKNPPAQ